MADKIAILRGIQKKNNGGLIVSDKIGETIAKVTKGNRVKYINQTEKSNVESMKIDNLEYSIVPYIPLTLERILVLLSGQSGSGKSLLVSLLIKQFMNHFKGYRIYFVSQTNFKDDINLKPLQLIQIDTDGIEELKIEDYKKTLWIMDDIDFHPNNKNIYKWLNKITELGRKFEVSLFFATHIHSKLNASPIYREVNLYITFPKSLNNNRQIENNLKINKNIIELLKENKDHAYICFNTVYSTIITDNIIMKY